MAMGLQKRSLYLPLTTTVLLNLAVMVLSATNFSRQDFPPYFVFGAGTSAYQVEGAVNEDGRTPSIWDTFTHDGRARGENGDVACDGYHKYKEDVQLMVETRLEAYKFSISWSRLIPHGRGPVNTKGLQYYNNLINELIQHGKLKAYFLQEYSLMKQGIIPPGRCSYPFGVVNCSKGNSTHEPYLAHHNMLLAHAAAVRLYKERYQGKQQGQIGISSYSFGFRPATDRKEDKIACERAFDFFVGWDLDPIVLGDYPATLKEIAGSKLPAFTKSESEQIRGSFDFIGIIFYANMNITDNPNNLERDQRDFARDAGIGFADPQAILTGDKSSYVFQGFLKTVKERYGNPPLFIHENGFISSSNSSLSDVDRVQYIQSYIGGLLNSLRNGSNIRGYFVWSFMDVFELLGGYNTVFGLYYVDRSDPDLKRYPKLPAQWYSRFLEGRSTTTVGRLALNNISHISVSHFFDT